MQLDVVVVGKSADILYLFGEPKLLIIKSPVFPKSDPTSNVIQKHTNVLRYHISPLGIHKHSILSVTFFFK